MKYLTLILLPLLMAACTTTQDSPQGYQFSEADFAAPQPVVSQTTSILMTAVEQPEHYAMMSPPASQVITPVSRFERKIIVPGGPDGEMTPCAKNFDGIMDHLESLMMPQIEENNRIAQAQAASPAFKF